MNIWVYTITLWVVVAAGNTHTHKEIRHSFAFDDRITPVLGLFLHKSDRKFFAYDILDEQTRDWQMINAIERSSDAIFDIDIRHRENSLFVVCKTLFDISPCGYTWHNNTKWAWLNSSELCGKGEKTLNEVERKKREESHNKRCDGIISVRDISVRDVIVVDKFTRLVTFERLMLTLDKVFSGSVNHNSIHRIWQDFEVQRNFASGGSEKLGDETKIVVMGESVAEKLGNLWRDQLELYKDAKTSNSTYSISRAIFPIVKLVNLASFGSDTIGFFACMSENPYPRHRCSEIRDKNSARQVQSTIPLTKPDVLVIHDEHWFRSSLLKENIDYLRKHREKQGATLATDLDMIFAMNSMLREAISNNVKCVFYLSQSAPTQIHEKDPKNHKNVRIMYEIEMNLVMRTVDTLGCKEGELGGIPFVIIDWTYLACPTLFKTQKCPKQAHGFDDILPDGYHPSGESGKWLAAQVLSVVMAKIAMMLPSDGYTDYPTWTVAMGNPISRFLHEQQKPDENQHMKNVTSFYYLCPVSGGLSELNASVAMSRKKHGSYNDSPFVIEVGDR